LEIVNPNAAGKDKTEIESQKYFSNSFGLQRLVHRLFQKTTSIIPMIFVSFSFC
jgi:hypothetical protein